MKLNKHKFALAAAITMIIVYVVCVVFTALLPNVALKSLGWVFHLINGEKFAGGVQVTFGGVILGLLPVIFYSYLTTYLFAWLYNKLLGSQS